MREIPICDFEAECRFVLDLGTHSHTKFQYGLEFIGRVVPLVVVGSLSTTGAMQKDVICLCLPSMVPPQIWQRPAVFWNTSLRSTGEREWLGTIAPRSSAFRRRRISRDSWRNSADASGVVPVISRDRFPPVIAAHLL